MRALIAQTRGPNAGPKYWAQILGQCSGAHCTTPPRRTPCQIGIVHFFRCEEPERRWTRPPDPSVRFYSRPGHPARADA